MRAPSEQFDLTGKVALITGGSRGMGRAIALGFARQGADLVIASRDGDACRAVAEEIERETGRRAFPHACHVGHWDQVGELVDAAYEEFGRVDVLVNNAGMSPSYDKLGDIGEELYDKVLAVNLKGPFRLSVLVGERMAAGDGGTIVNVTSLGAIRPTPHAAPYSAAKAGMESLTLSLAHAFGTSVRVNSVLPGAFLTDISKHWDMDEFAERAQQFALRRGGEPEEIVGAILYLASPASSYTTGASLRVDGGWP